MRKKIKYPRTIFAPNFYCVEAYNFIFSLPYDQNLHEYHGDVCICYRNEILKILHGLD
jgi:hypothetical protein